ncbi:MAG: type II toxin-antitoxin system VapC family toxin [Acidimicrobiales bacterium]
MARRPRSTARSRSRRRDAGGSPAVARRRQRAQIRGHGVPDGVVLDSGALSAAAKGDARVRAELTLAQQFGVEVHVSSVTLAETLRGHRRDARAHAVLASTAQDAVTPHLGRAAGELLGRTNRDDTIDAVVAVSAEVLGRRVRLLTGDPDDMGALTTDMSNVAVIPI